MENLRGKRLLLLSAGLWKDAIKTFADTNGITLISAGTNPRTSCCTIAAEAYDVDPADAEAVKALIRQKKIDGAYMGANEQVIGAASSYLNEIGLPCYCTKPQWDTFQNKANFKRLCSRFGLPTVKWYELQPDLSDLNGLKLRYPLVTKPEDGCGSCGFTVCHDEISLLKGYVKAAAASAAGRVIVEEFVNNIGIMVSYVFSNGQASLARVEDEFPIRYEYSGSYVNGFLSSESACREEFIRLFDEKLRAMFASLGLKEGTLWMEVFRDNGRYYFNEAGYRYNGTLSIYPENYFSDINQVAADIYYALTGQSRLQGFPSLLPPQLPRKKKYGIYCLHTLPGRIDRITGEATLRARDNIAALKIFRQAGDYIRKTGTFSQINGFVHFVYNDVTEYKETVEFIHDTLQILDKDGRNLLNRVVLTDPHSFFPREAGAN